MKSSLHERLRAGLLWLAELMALALAALPIVRLEGWALAVTLPALALAYVAQRSRIG